MIHLLYIDLFCGAGGTSTGVETAVINGNQCAKVIACVNHDANAIASHAANHPDALHFTEDIRTLDLTLLIEHTRKMLLLHPNAQLVLWASLECTNFSKAKGGKARNADSRTLAEHLYRYIIALDPDYIQIENVEEFMSWGDIDENGKPISRDKGKMYLKWLKHIRKFGYNFDYRILNSADFGAYTSRKRFFGQFAKDYLPIVWPEPTHTKISGPTNMFGLRNKWKAVKEVLDLQDDGLCIFGRKKPLSDKTLERIYAGLIKFVAGGKNAFTLRTYATASNSKGIFNIDNPHPTVTTREAAHLIQPLFISKYYSGDPESKNVSIDEPAGAITTKDHHSLISTNFLSAYYGNGDNVSDIENPAPTIGTKDTLALITSNFIVNNYSGGGWVSDIENPSSAVTSVPKQNLVTTQFMDQQWGNSKPSDIDSVCGAITTNPKHNLVSCVKWIMDTGFNNVGSSLEEPSKVITANRKWHYLMNPQFASPGGSIENPCFTLIAKMDKKPPYLVVTESGDLSIQVYESDTEITVKIKEFMALYGIIDIKMRMLKIIELLQIMGFPKTYSLFGTQAEQKKYLGNAVEVTIARALCEAICYKVLELRKSA